MNHTTFLDRYAKDHPTHPHCDHDKDKALTLGGTWKREGGKIICRICGAFYGYVRETK